MFDFLLFGWQSKYCVCLLSRVWLHRLRVILSQLLKDAITILRLKTTERREFIRAIVSSPSKKHRKCFVYKRLFSFKRVRLIQRQQHHYQQRQQQNKTNQKKPLQQLVSDDIFKYVHKGLSLVLFTRSIYILFFCFFVCFGSCLPTVHMYLSKGGNKSEKLKSLLLYV